jgi:hypothetical protein
MSNEASVYHIYIPFREFPAHARKALVDGRGKVTATVSSDSAAGRMDRSAFCASAAKTAA